MLSLLGSPENTGPLREGWTLMISVVGPRCPQLCCSGTKATAKRPFECPTLNALQVESGDCPGFLFFNLESSELGLIVGLFSKWKAERLLSSFLGLQEARIWDELTWVRHRRTPHPPSFPWGGGRHCQKRDSNCQKCMKSAVQMVKQKSRLPLFCDRGNVSNSSSRSKRNSNTSTSDKGARPLLGSRS